MRFHDYQLTIMLVRHGRFPQLAWETMFLAASLPHERAPAAVSRLSLPLSLGVSVSLSLERFERYGGTITDRPH